MEFFQNLSIRNKLVLISLIPVLGLLFYLQSNVRLELNNKDAAEQVLLDVAEIEQLTILLHELQKERALSVVFVTSSGTRSNEILLGQREFTDKAIFELRKVLNEHDRKLNNLWLIDSLSVLRLRTNNTGEYNDHDDELYIEGKTLMIDEINRILRASKNQTLKNLFEDHLFLLYAKDYLGILRAELSKSLIAGKFEKQAYGKFSSYKGKYEINLQKLKKLASPEFKKFLDEKFQGPFVDQMNNCMALAFNNPEFKIMPCTFEAWYANASAAINLLKEAEDFSSDLIRRRAQQEAETASQNVVQAVTLAVLLLIFILVAITFTVKNIVSSVQQIKRAAELMAEGEVDISLDIRFRDEIGDLANTFGKMMNSAREFSGTADIIGKGDYSQRVIVRSEKDVLGTALESMRNNLQKLSKENFIRTWLLSGNAELNDRIRGEKDVKELADNVVVQVASYLKAQVGALYLKNNERLYLAGSYAFQHRKNNTNMFKLGQGLVGQAALEKKTIIFSDIPNDYIKISSGLGNTTPRNVIVFPFQYIGEVKGVIELGAAHEFSDLDVQFLELVGNNIAIAFNASQSREKLKELLEETQRQAEELESQQDELKQVNEELMEKTQLLERSETELKSQQEELQQSNEELEEKANMLEEQKDRLELVKMETENKARELEVISKYKSEFLANMSHELRTPLNSILILAQLLAENKNNVLMEKECDFAKNIYSSGTDLLNLINEILDLSKVEAGKMELDIVLVPFQEIVTDIKGMFDEIARSKSIDFKVEMADRSLEGGKIETDKLRLEQVLRNLLSNAFKFTDKGGKVSLTIRAARSNKSSPSETVAFEVKDSGIGIPAEKQGIIFEAFQQADGSTKRKYGGTGLGLSICREFSHALGGEIQLQSAEGTGSTFTLYLPLAFNKAFTAYKRIIEKAEPKKIKEENAITVENLSKQETDVADDRYAIGNHDKLVLIVEDDPAFARLLLGFVHDRNYKGIIANQGNMALSYARNYKPDAIILDMKLPVMNGSEVLKQLKSDPQLRHIPVQIISGYDMRKEGLELGALDYAIKPISKEDFQRAFDKLEDFVSRKLKKLLIVEDNELQNNAIRELIGNGDVKCFSSYSGQEAYETLKKENFDCTIVDLGLPDMSGFDLLEKIKGDDKLNKMPIIVYTGKDLSKEESSRLNKLASTVVLKTADSQERLLDETTLFLHRVESRLPKEKQNIIRKLHRTDEVLKQKYVLIVDDDIRNIYSLTNALEEEGMNCLVAENGKIALKVLEENSQVDIVLMDVMMPEMDGYEATREIRKSTKFGKVPVIALTAKAMKGDREKCLAAGMSDYVSKPVNIDQLLSLMRVWLYQ